MNSNESPARAISAVKSVLIVALVCAVVVVASGTAAFAQLSGDGDVTFTSKSENCNGIIPTPGSQNTVKTLTGGSLIPGGTASYQISYPVDASDVGDDFAIADCVLYGTGSDLKTYSVLDQGEFHGVVNSTAFHLSFHVSIPDNIPVGTRVCNVAKTTEGPSAPQSSNRKAGPACFTVGGDARVEKHSTTNRTALLGGATFSVWDCNNSADDPTLQPIILTPAASSGSIYSNTVGGGGIVHATDGFIAFGGPSGSTCKVTETVAPDGYQLPAVADRTVTVTLPVGSSAVTYDFFDPPAPGSLRITKVAPTGSTETFTFSITCTNPSHTYTGLSITGSGSTTQSDIPAGSSCTVAETSPGSTYNAPTYSPSATVTIASGETVAVTVTNSLKPGSLTITKVAPAGSTATFTFSIACTNPSHTYTGLSITGSGSTTQSDIPAGSSCTVSETDPGSTYNPPSYDPSGAVTIEANQTVTVTVTNSLKSGSLTITKVAPAGSTATFDFDITCTNPSHTYSELSITGSGSTTQTGIPAGSSCTVSESDPGSAYNTPTYDPSGAVTIGANQGVTVTVTNTLKPGSLTITKVAPDGVDDTFTFDITCTNPSDSYQLAIVGSGSATQEGIPADSSCTVSEVVPAGYAQPTFDPGDTVAIGAGQSVTVTATNTFLPLGISIVKTAAPVSGSPGDPVTYTYDVTNTGKVDLLNVSVDDDKLGHIGDIASLAVGETVTLTKDTTLPSTSVTNVGTAVGHDRFGREARAQDTATVTVVLGVILQRTGTDTRWPFVLGTILTLIGAAFVITGRRRPEIVQRDRR